MPRKQRFKPSRKPKQPQTSEITEIQPTSSPNSAGEIEHAEPARTQGDRVAVIEDTDDTHRA
jgi:hypothetical protein